MVGGRGEDMRVHSVVAEATVSLASVILACVTCVVVGVDRSGKSKYTG